MTGVVRRFLLICCLCILAAALTGCKKARLRSQLKELMGSTIVLPEKIMCVYGGEVYPMPDSLRSKAKLLVYVDSTECSTCWLSHYASYEKVFDVSRSSGAFDVVILLPNQRISGIPLMRYVADQEIGRPFYVDFENAFPSMNPAMTQDQRLHAVLIDGAGIPLFVGDPTVSERMFELFMISIENFN